VKFVPKKLENTAEISRGDHSWRTFIKNALSVLLTIAALYLLLGASADLVASKIPERWEADLFSWEYPDWDQQSESYLRASAMLDILISDDTLRPLPYSLAILPDSAPNAFALPGGTILLTQGLLDSVGSDSGLAFVIGHELGHHQYRHTLKRIGRSLVFQTAMAMLFGASSRSVIHTSLTLAESSHSRGQERQADEFGINLVLRYYGNDGAALEFFKDLQAAAATGEADWAAFLSSHPLTEVRLAYLRGQLEE